MSDKFWHQRSYCGNTLWNAISDRLKIERRNLIKMKQENTRKREKMIMVEKSTKWWMTVVASGSLAVGLLGGLGIGSLATNALNQQVQECLQVDNKTEITKVVQMECHPNKMATKVTIVIAKMAQETVITQRKKLHQMLTVQPNQIRIVARQKIMIQIQQILNISEEVMI